MKPFEITTPALKEVEVGLRDVLNGTVTGVEADRRIKAANAAVKIIGAELKNKLKNANKPIMVTKTRTSEE